MNKKVGQILVNPSGNKVNATPGYSWYQVSNGRVKPRYTSDRLIPHI